MRRRHRQQRRLEVNVDQLRAPAVGTQELRAQSMTRLCSGMCASNSAPRLARPGRAERVVHFALVIENDLVPQLRYPKATRPWPSFCRHARHVSEVSQRTRLGYLLRAARLQGSAYGRRPLPRQNCEACRQFNSSRSASTGVFPTSPNSLKVFIRADYQGKRLLVAHSLRKRLGECLQTAWVRLAAQE
jgi:hypothetical protein